MKRAGLLFFLALFLALPARAEGDASLFQVMDVAEDVTSDQAIHARDEAMVKAQRDAFLILADRLGADPKKIGDLSADAVASLVQAIEVQQEKTSAVRYIGTFTVQFKPAAVRALLAKKGTNFSEVRSRPMLVLPLASFDGKEVLWDEGNKWRAVWKEAARGSSLVPLLVPTADAEDSALLSAQDALAGKTEALTALIRKYQATGALVAVLNADPDKAEAQKAFKIVATRYDFFGKAANSFNLAQTPDSGAASLSASVRQVRAMVEKEFQQSAKNKGPVVHLPVLVPVMSLAEWNGIKKKIDNIPAIQKTNLLSLARGGAKIEIEFHGDPASLAEPLAVEGLRLEPIDGVWNLIEMSVSISERIP
jgi:hypothetical protein